jgi:hypothetical protein
MLIVFVALCRSVLHAQNLAISGTVVDSKGEPIAGAAIDFALPMGIPSGPTSGADGTFSVLMRGPALVIRKPGFQSVRLLTQDAATRPVKVVLTVVEGQPPLCSPIASFAGLEKVGFRFPKKVDGVLELEPKPNHFGVDTGTDFFEMTYRRAGANKNGVPDYVSVRDSVEYQEIVYNYHGFRLIDAWGKKSDGKVWREIRLADKYVGYPSAVPSAAVLFDQMMNSFCIDQNAPPDSEPAPTSNESYVTRTSRMLQPKEISVSGVVVDSLGNPIAGALVDNAVVDVKGTNKPVWEQGPYILDINGLQLREGSTMTNADGLFAIKTWGPALIVRKAGYRSVRLSIPPGGETSYRVVLSSEGVEPIAPLCAAPAKFVRRNEATFYFPTDLRGVRPRSKSNLSFFIVTNSGRKNTEYGLGPDWGDGLTSWELVWRSVDYQEVVSDYGGLWLVDARGTMPNGQKWRYIGLPEESASYGDLRPDEAALFDQVFDELCLQAATPQSMVFRRRRPWDPPPSTTPGVPRSPSIPVP